MKKITIAIDGFSSTGKSTLAKQLAQQLGYIYVDTGAMYRAVTLYAMQHGFVSPNHLDAEGLMADLNKITLHFVFNSELGYGEMYLNGVNVEREIRTLEVSSLVSKVAEISAVRTRLVEEQQAMGKEKGVVMDGRDIGTVVFPDAALKIYMTASPATRAQRRFSELQAKGDSVTYEEVLQNVNQRDYIDTHRADSPLLKAEDAIELDNSNLGREDQLQLVMEWVAAKTKSM